MVRTNQGGSILSFIIIGSVMALLLVGGAYLVRNTLAPADRGDDIALEPNEEEGSTEEPSRDEPDEAEGEGEEVSPQPDEEAEPGADAPVDEEPEETDEAPEEAAQDPLPVAGNNGGTNTPSSLPETGMSDVLLGAVMLAVLAVLVVEYARSRELPASL